jgi:hypothetical protein
LETLVKNHHRPRGGIDPCAAVGGDTQPNHYAIVTGRVVGPAPPYKPR